MDVQAQIRKKRKLDTFQESIHLAPGLCLQASSQKFRLHRLLPWDRTSCEESLLESGDLSVTRQMMAGAFFAGFSQRAADEKEEESAPPAAPSLLRHIHSLACSYQTTHATPPTMRRVGAYFAAQGRNDVAAYCLHVAEEETGHDTLALMDIAALGLPAQEFVARLRPKNSLALVELFTRHAGSSEPIAVLGYAYALERYSLLFNTETTVAAFERLIPAGIKATRCLRVHSSVSKSEVRHLTESLEFIATLPPQDRAAIARTVYETVQLSSTALPDYPGDDAMRALLGEFGWTMTEEALS